MHVLNLGSFLTKDQPVYLSSTWNIPGLLPAKQLIIVHWANGLPPALAPWHSTEQIQEGPSPASVSPNQRSRLSIIITMSQATNLSSFHWKSGAGYWMKRATHMWLTPQGFSTVSLLAKVIWRLPLTNNNSVCANMDLDKEMASGDTHLEDSPKDSKYFGK